MKKSATRSHRTKRRSTRTAVLAHPKHTGKRLKHRHTSFEVLVMVVLSVGVIMAGAAFQTRALTVTVSAKVPAPLPTVPAVITSPVADSRFASLPIPVSGTCQAGDLVKLYRNSVFSGSVLCAAANTFSLDSSLFAGANDLTTKVFNITDDEGPNYGPLTVYYDPPPPPPASETPSSGSGSSGQSSTPSPEPFAINAESAYQGFKVGETVAWELDIVGGSRPYAITIDWGDGTISTISRDQDGPFSASHIYDKEGGYLGGYTVSITAADASGNSSFLQVVLIVQDTDKIAQAVVASTGSDPLPPFQFPLQWNVLWPAYGVTLLMAVSFWLGERRELRVLHSPHRRRPLHT